MKEVVLDQSFFNTPSRATAMYAYGCYTGAATSLQAVIDSFSRPSIPWRRHLFHLNLRNALATYKLSTNLKALSLVNVNLDQVPEQLETLTALTKLYVHQYSHCKQGVADSPP